MWNLLRLNKKVFISQETIIKWCIDKNLIKIPNCDICNSVMKIDLNRCQFRCRLNDHEFNKSLRNNSWFEDSNLKLETIIIITYLFSIGVTKYETIRRETKLGENSLTDKTIAKWLAFYKDICLVWLNNKQQTNGLIGGPNSIVQIDESKFGKRKFNKGRRIEGKWVFGMLDLGTKENPKNDLRLELCEGNLRNEQTLLPLIQKHVHKVSIIISDMWRAYYNLNKNGYEHYTVNHKENFVDPITKFHTQNIESCWRQLKRDLSSGGHKRKYLIDDLAVSQWRKAVKEMDAFEEFLNAIILAY